MYDLPDNQLWFGEFLKEVSQTEYEQNTTATGTVVFSSTQVVQGTIYATAPENLVVAYIPASNSEMGRAFNLTADQTGYIGMKHFEHNETFTQQTLIVSGVLLFPERLDGVVKVEIGVAPEA